MSERVTAKGSCPCRGRPWEDGVNRVLSWECGHCGVRWTVRPGDVEEIARLRAENAVLRERIEELTRWADDGGRVHESEVA